MKYLFYCGHPAQFLFFKNFISSLKSNGHRVFIAIKKKDIKDNKLSIFSGLLNRYISIFSLAKKYKPDILVGSDPSLAQIGKLTSMSTITTLEDNYLIIKSLAKLTFMSFSILSSAIFQLFSSKFAE